jgi:hypothetical protein
MRQRYNLCITKYICGRHGCGSPIELESASLYEFAGPDDPAFWCPKCEDLPHAELVGWPATDLPPRLQLPQGFVLFHVPRFKPTEDLDSANLLYRPYSQRSFLRQYIDWLKLKGIERICEFSSSATCFKKFDPTSQAFTDEIDCDLQDHCDGAPCQFLRFETLKHVSEDELYCAVLKRLCDARGPYRLCQTRDEAQILLNYLLLTGADHFPMLIPQPSILSGWKRPDFLCFVPITRYQYHRVVVLVDRPGKDPKSVEAEQFAYEHQGYLVERILIDWEGDTHFSYFKAARALKNRIEWL